MMQRLSDRPNRNRWRSGITLTPLIDVVFILLVFFMLASSFEKNRSVELVPPVEGKSAPSADRPETMRLRIIGADHYELGPARHTLESLNSALDENREKTLLIETTETAALQDLVAVLDLTGSLSLPRVSLLPMKELAP